MNNKTKITILGVFLLCLATNFHQMYAQPVVSKRDNAWTSPDRLGMDNCVETTQIHQQYVCIGIVCHLLSYETVISNC